MARKKAASEDMHKDDVQMVVGVFSRFEAEGYALNPHASTWMRVFFEQLGAIFLGIILLIAFSAVFVFQRAGDRESLTQRLRTGLTYPYYSHKWCQATLPDGMQFFYIYPKDDDQKCSDLRWAEPLAVTPPLDGRDGNAFLIIWNTIADIIPISLSLLLSILTFQDVTRKTPKYLAGLAKAGRLMPPSSRKASDAGIKPALWARIRAAFDINPQGWESFTGDFENSLRSKWGLALFLIWLALAFILDGQFVKSLHVFELNDFWMTFHYFMVLGVLGLFLVYLMGYGIWMMIVIGAYIRKLSPVFELDIEPGHGDGCGGLKRLGDLCFEMALTVIYPMVVIAVFILVGAFSASIPAFRAGMSIGLGVAILIAAVIFFWPLLDIHKDMLDAMRKFQDEAAARIGKTEQELRDLFGSGSYDGGTVKVLEDRLEKLKKLYPADLNFPVWPFTTKIVVAFYTSQIVPIITVITGLYDFFGKFGSSSG